MIVECEKIYRDGSSLDCEIVTDCFLTIGKRYQVLEFYSKKDETLIRIQSDDTEFNAPILVRVNEFKVISGKIPKNWGIEQCNPEYYLFSPQKWLDWPNSFWEDYFDGKAEAKECYQQELEVIEATDEL